MQYHVEVQTLFAPLISLISSPSKEKEIQG